MTRLNPLVRTAGCTWLLLSAMLLARPLAAQSDPAPRPSADSGAPAGQPAAADPAAAAGFGQPAGGGITSGGDENGQASGGGGFGYGRGGYGSSGAGMMYGGGDMYGGPYESDASPPLNIVVREGKSSSDNRRVKTLSASRVIPFYYELGSMKPSKATPYSGMGSGYGGGDMYAGLGMAGGGYGDDSGHGGSMGGGGYGDGTYGMENSQSHAITIYAYVIDKDQTDGRARIELVTESSSKASPPGSGPSGGMPGGMGAAMYGAAGPGRMQQPKQFDRLDMLLESQAAQQGKHRAKQVTPTELKLVADTIRQMIWKEDVVRKLNQQAGDPEQLEAAERLLKELLTEEYDTQLARQELEITDIEQRIVRLRDELVRRRAAKSRVVDVQLGKIVLEAQGLLGR